MQKRPRGRKLSKTLEVYQSSLGLLTNIAEGAVVGVALKTYPGPPRFPACRYPVPELVSSQCLRGVGGDLAEPFAPHGNLLPVA